MSSSQAPSNSSNNDASPRSNAASPNNAQSSSSSKNDANSNEGLLPVNVPKTLVDRFKDKSNYNSSKVIETGGLICGSKDEESNEFDVTHLIIPEQTGTADSWRTIDKDDTTDYRAIIERLEIDIAAASYIF